MNANNLSITQNLFSDLSLNSKSTSNSPPSNSLMEQSPEIYDLIRFQNAIMLKYMKTQDPHYKNIANSLTPQIQDKIRELNRNN